MQERGIWPETSMTPWSVASLNRMICQAMQLSAIKHKGGSKWA